MEATRWTVLLCNLEAQEAISTVSGTRASPVRRPFDPPQALQQWAVGLAPYPKASGPCIGGGQAGAQVRWLHSAGSVLAASAAAAGAGGSSAGNSCGHAPIMRKLDM